MKTVELTQNPITVDQLLEWASLENVMIRRNGEKFVVAMVDDFAAEVESLRNNDEFIAFLDARAKEPKIPIAEARKRLLEQD